MRATAHSSEEWLPAFLNPLIRRMEPYHELGGDHFDKRRPDVTAKRLVKGCDFCMALASEITASPTLMGYLDTNGKY